MRELIADVLTVWISITAGIFFVLLFGLPLWLLVAFTIWMWI